MPHRFSPLLALPLLVFALLLAGCDSGGGDGDDDPLNGTWRSVSDGAVDYIQIDLPDLEGYEDEGDCYDLYEEELERVSDNTFRFSGQDETFTLEVENDVLTVTEGDDVTRFEESNADVSRFDLCNE
jgi:hypothetical protein